MSDLTADACLGSACELNHDVNEPLNAKLTLFFAPGQSVDQNVYRLMLSLTISLKMGVSSS